MQDAGFFGFDLDIAFVGLDFSDHVAQPDRFAILFFPFDQNAFFHRVAHLGHDYFCHSFLFL